MDHILILPFFADLQAEKTQQAFLKGVEAFDQNKLKPTETQEKIVLPDKEGKSENELRREIMTV